MAGKDDISEKGGDPRTTVRMNQTITLEFNSPRVEGVYARRTHFGKRGGVVVIEGTIKTGDRGKITVKMDDDPESWKSELRELVVVIEAVLDSDEGIETLRGTK